MGIRDEKRDLVKYGRVYKSLKIDRGRDIFSLAGRIVEWDEAAIIARIFYKQLEELLYTRDIERVIYERTVKRKLKKHNLLNKSLFDVLYLRRFDFERMKLLLVNIDDYVYFNVKKFLPYIKHLSLITSAANELFENTIRYSSGSFFMKTWLDREDEYPLKLSMENRYKNKNGVVINNILKLKKDIDEVNNMNFSPEALHNFLQKMGSQHYEHKLKEEIGFGLAKIRFETKAIFEFIESSEHFGDHGVTINLKVPMTLLSKDELLDKVKEVLRK